MSDKSVKKPLAGRLNLKSFNSVLGLLVLFIVSSLISQSFLTGDNLLNILRQSSTLGFMALGLTLVIITGNIDLSIGGTISLAAVLTAVLLPKTGVLPTIIIVVLSGVLIGVINGLILSYWKIEAFVVTLGMQTLLNGLAFMFSNGRTVIVDNIPDVMMALSNASVFGGFPVSFIILLIFYIALYIWSKKTKMGRYIYALGGNEEVCYISGVNVTIIRVTAYTICGMMAAVAGLFAFSRAMCGDPTTGQSMTNMAIASVIIGGTKFNGGKGSIALTVIGLLVMGIINNILNLTGAPYYTQQMVQGLVIIGAVVLSSQKRR